MAAKNYYCNVKQGFEFRQDVQDPVGIVTALKIGQKDLKADFSEIISAEDGKKKVKAAKRTRLRSTSMSARPTRWS